MVNRLFSFQSEENSQPTKSGGTMLSKLGIWNYRWLNFLSNWNFCKKEILLSAIVFPYHFNKYINILWNSLLERVFWSVFYSCKFVYSNKIKLEKNLVSVWCTNNFYYSNKKEHCFEKNSLPLVTREFPLNASTFVKLLNFSSMFCLIHFVEQVRLSMEVSSRPVNLPLCVCVCEDVRVWCPVWRCPCLKFFIVLLHELSRV